jgi:hypothetical protein
MKITDNKSRSGGEIPRINQFSTSDPALSSFRDEAYENLDKMERAGRKELMLKLADEFQRVITNCLDLEGQTFFSVNSLNGGNEDTAHQELVLTFRHRDVEPGLNELTLSRDIPHNALRDYQMGGWVTQRDKLIITVPNYEGTLKITFAQAFLRDYQGESVQIPKSFEVQIDEGETALIDAEIARIEAGAAVRQSQIKHAEALCRKLRELNKTLQRYATLELEDIIGPSISEEDINNFPLG